MAPQEGIQAAVNLSSGADQVVICTWLNGDWEGEGHDRPNMLLPGHTDTLTSAVAEANPQTMAVLQAGTPVEMSWLDKVSGLIQEWNGGNETGNAIADVLFGDYNPSEKLSLSWPATSKHNPAWLSFRSERGRTLYREDVYVGYRYYEAVDREVAFAFGFGLSYTKFDMSNASVELIGQELVIHVTIENVGTSAGSEVIQYYIAQDLPSIRRPRKELQAFEKVFFAPSQRKIVGKKLSVKVCN
jgi:beta-glucosidase